MSDKGNADRKHGAISQYRISAPSPLPHPPMGCQSLQIGCIRGKSRCIIPNNSEDKGRALKAEVAHRGKTLNKQRVEEKLV